MISLTSKPKLSPVHVVTLPSYCVPTEESNDLAVKREAQLQWMRAKGMTYLGDPQKPLEKKAPRQRAVGPMRLVSIRGNAPDARHVRTDTAQEA
jgi:hypothetical protein